MKIKISDIKIGERQRIDLGDIDELADSMSRNGQIHNIGVTPDMRLIWGRRRLAAATQLQWSEIEATVRDGLTPTDEQELELEEDIKRKSRTWQEETIAVAKLFALKGRQARAKGESFGVREMAEYIGMSKSVVACYVFEVAEPLMAVPRDEEIWSQPGFHKALDILRDRQEKQTAAEINRRRELNAKIIEPVAAAIKANPIVANSSPGSVPIPDKTPKQIGMHIPLRDRAMLYNNAFKHLGPPNTDLFYSNKNNREFLTGFWFVGGQNISALYGSYQVEYLRRIETLFPDATKVIHLFVGSLPPSDRYLRVGLAQGDNKPDIECDAHYLSSKLPFKCDLIYADPPYSVEDAEHYDNAMVNRERVLEECALVLNDNGYIVWIDQALPIFKNELLAFVGAIGYIRSTGNRFRIVSLFRKANKQCPPTTSTQASQDSKSPSSPASSPTPAKE